MLINEMCLADELFTLGYYSPGASYEELDSDLSGILETPRGEVGGRD